MYSGRAENPNLLLKVVVYAVSGNAVDICLYTLCGEFRVSVRPKKINHMPITGLKRVSGAAPTTNEKIYVIT